MKKQELPTPTPGAMSRRTWLSLLPAAALLPQTLSQSQATTALYPSSDLPAKDLFRVKGAFLNAAYTHPLSIKAAEALNAYTERRLTNDRASDQTMGDHRREAVQRFARLINASPEALAWIPSTMVGENLIVSGLGLPGTSGRVVTDAYHFDGSLYLYGQLAKQGLDLAVVRPRDNRIHLEDLDAAITPGTKLVALSLVSMINGFQHDLKAVCELAHARGALVYADIIQAAGAVPIDVRASGVDFCACSSFKWLMGDFGAGFLYVRPDRLERLTRSQYGYRQMASYTSHVLPFDPPGEAPFDWTAQDDVGGYFQVGTLSNPAIAALRESLGYLLDTGVDRIQAYRQPLIDRLQAELPKLGYASMTPADSTSPIVSFAFRDAARRLRPRLEEAGITIQLYENRLRISPSVYNDMGDVERLIEVLR